MKTSTAFVPLTLALMLITTTIGCGQAYRQIGTTTETASGTTGTPTGNGGVDVDGAMAKAQVNSANAQRAINDARTAIAGISDPSGNIAMNLFGSIWSSITGSTNGAGPTVIDVSGSGINVVGRGLLSPLVVKLQDVFNLVFAKVDEVNDNLNAARLELATAAARLDANDPLQALALGQINKQMRALDVMEKTFRTQLVTLAGKVDVAKAQLSKLVTFGTSFIPVPGLNILAGMLVDTFLLSDVNNLLDAVKLKLLLA